MTRLYKILLRLYPASHRSAFGAEMISVFRLAEADVRGKGALHQTIFYLRELSGLIADALQLQAQTAASCPESWIRSLEAPIAAILLFRFCVGIGRELGLWGFFFPGTYVLVASLGGLAAWVMGRECRLAPSGNQWRRVFAIFVIFAVALPVAARATEEVWARLLLSRSDDFAFTFPGVDVAVSQGLPDHGETTGLTFSRMLRHSDGRIMTMLQHEDRDAPPYLFLGGLAVAAIALWSRRTVAEKVIACQ